MFLYFPNQLVAKLSQPAPSLHLKVRNRDQFNRTIGIVQAGIKIYYPKFGHD